MTALARLTATETILFFRDPLNVAFVLTFPPVLIVIFGVIPAFREPAASLDGLRVIDLYAPIVVAVAIATIALTTLPPLLASYRERGVLRRMQTTPVRPLALLTGQVLMSGGIAAVTALVVLAIAALAFGVPLPRQPLAYLLAFALTASAMFAIGLLVGTLAPTGTSATALGMVVYFPVLFFAGLWIPRTSMNDTLRTISDFTPLGAGAQALQDAASGQWPQVLHVAVILGWTIVAGALAARYFRWE